MTIEELREALQKIIDEDSADVEQIHIDADKLLLLYIGDLEVLKLHNRLAVFYA